MFKIKIKVFHFHLIQTCCGGRPPAPAAQTGSIVSFVSVLHSQDGEGFLESHAGLDKMFVTSGDTGGTSQSEVVFKQVKRFLYGHIILYHFFY